jgi:hypothetical protein
LKLKQLKINLTKSVSKKRIVIKIKVVKIKNQLRLVLIKLNQLLLISLIIIVNELLYFFGF